MLLSGGEAGETAYVLIGFAILGFSFAQSSGAVASLFGQRNRYTGSAFVSALSWMFGAGFAPVTALLLSSTFGLAASGPTCSPAPSARSCRCGLPARLPFTRRNRKAKPAVFEERVLRPGRQSDNRAFSCTIFGMAWTRLAVDVPCDPEIKLKLTVKTV